MKPFTQFLTEAKDRYDREGTAIGGGGLSHRGGTKIGSDRKKERGDMPSPHSKGQAKPRVKAIGGGKTAPAKQYKTRKDAGEQRPKGRSSERLQQPTRERGSAKLSPREQQRKAAQERRAAKSGGSNKKDLEKAATQLLTKKKKATDPSYKPRKASGLTTKERKALYKKGERTLRDIALKSTGKTKESELKHPITQKEITRRNKKK